MSRLRLSSHPPTYHGELGTASCCRWNPHGWPTVAFAAACSEKINGSMLVVYPTISRYPMISPLHTLISSHETNDYDQWIQWSLLLATSSLRKASGLELFQHLLVLRTIPGWCGWLEDVPFLGDLPLEIRYFHGISYQTHPKSLNTWGQVVWGIPFIIGNDGTGSQLIVTQHQFAYPRNMLVWVLDASNPLGATTS